MRCHAAQAKDFDSPRIFFFFNLHGYVQNRKRRHII